MQDHLNGKECPHQRTIICIETNVLSDLPEVGSNPAAVIWEQRVVACNEPARCCGVQEEMSVGCAVERCPGLIILSAHQIPQLGVVVEEVNAILRGYSLSLERVSLDLCYLELTSHPQVKNSSNGFIRNGCSCGCRGRLNAARQLVCQLQATVQASVHVRSRIGISCSKLLAQLAAMRSAMGECRVVPPECLPSSSPDIRDLPLTTFQGHDAELDRSPVVQRDMWRLICVEFEIWEKFCVLLLRLLSLVVDDGRIPLAVKVSVRKMDLTKRTCSKDSRTASIPCGLVTPAGRMAQDTVMRLMGTVMGQFRRLVDSSRPVHLSLLGLAFVRFRETRSVATCLLRKREISVEAPVDINLEGCSIKAVEKEERAASPELPDDVVAPCDKKAKLDVVAIEAMDLCSPSKLNVGDLSLGDDVASRTKRLRRVLQC